MIKISQQAYGLKKTEEDDDDDECVVWGLVSRFSGLLLCPRCVGEFVCACASG